MSTKVPIPFFPSAPNEYDANYITQIVRAFAIYTEQQNAGGEGRNTGLVLTNLQSHDDNLEVGSLFDHDGFVKISRADRPHPRGSLGTTGLGSVTVDLPLMGKRSNFERVEKDYYPTPLEAVHPLIPHILGYVKTFAEPCAGDGSLIRHIEYLTNNLFDIDYIRCNYACDIEPKDDGIHEKNIFNLLPKDIETSDVIITNPPWSRDILHRLIYHCTSIKPTWLLFDADWMHTKQSTHYRDMLKKIVSVGRVEWIKGSKNTGKDNCCWYYFDKDNKEQTQFFGRQT